MRRKFPSGRQVTMDQNTDEGLHGILYRRSVTLLSLIDISLISADHPNGTAAAGPPEIRPVVLLHGYDPLKHQPIPVFVSFQSSHCSLILTRDHREEFKGEFRKPRILTSLIHSVGNPLLLLRHNIRGGKDLPRGIEQEEDEYLAVTRFGGILQAEWLDLVLVQVRKRDTSMGLGDHIAHALHTRGVSDTHIAQFTGGESQVLGDHTFPYRKAPAYTLHRPGHEFVVRR